jgi:hypothetical protein
LLQSAGVRVAGPWYERYTDEHKGAALATRLLIRRAAPPERFAWDEEALSV